MEASTATSEGALSSELVAGPAVLRARARRGAVGARGVHHGEDVVVGGDLPNGVVPRIGDEQITRRIQRHALRCVQAGGRRRASVAAETALALEEDRARAVGNRRRDLVGREVASNRGDHPGAGVDPADHVVCRIGNVDVAVAVHGHPGWLGQLRRRAAGPPSPL